MIMESTDIRPDFFLALYISSFHERENILPSEIYEKSFGLVLINYIIFSDIHWLSESCKLK